MTSQCDGRRRWLRRLAAPASRQWGVLGWGVGLGGVLRQSVSGGAPGAKILWRGARRQPRGMVTFELAVGMLSAAVVTAMLGWGISLLGLQARCVDVAAQVARQSARDDSAGVEQAKAKAPKDAEIKVVRDDDQINVTVSTDARLGVLGPVHISGSAVAVHE